MLLMFNLIKLYLQSLSQKSLLTVLDIQNQKTNSPQNIFQSL